MRNRAYILLVVVVLLLQITVLNNLAITPLVAPTIYILVLLFLPIEKPQWQMLGIGLLLGLFMDITMGTAGLNVIVTLPVAYFRRMLLFSLTGLSTLSTEEGTPTVKRLGTRFHNYAIAVILLHSLLFYSVEWLSLQNLGFLSLRILCSSVVSLILDYTIILLFSKRLSAGQTR
ncbi:MAG: hypothetical protein IKA49_01530 [Alistipes sp.]|nr:hypothetical protein [Alistipes sp.]